MFAFADNQHSTLSLVGTMCKDIHSNMYTKAVVSLCPCQQFLYSLKFSLILVKSLQFVALFSRFPLFLSAGLTLSVLSLYGFVFYVSVHFHITVFCYILEHSFVLNPMFQFFSGSPVNFLDGM